MFLEIISDIFGRLHYMERRGSGIQRIMNSYTDFVEQPEFYSDDTQFLVTMPNRGVATLVEKSPLLDQESSLQGGKSSLQKESSISSIEVVLIDLFQKILLLKLASCTRRMVLSTPLIEKIWQRY